MSGTEILIADYVDEKEWEIEYPESDGEPMGETEVHVIALLHLLGTLRYFFRNHDDLYVIGDMFLYYEKGNPRAKKAPDIMVVKGVSKERRRIFRLWEEAAAPSVIFEITSESTKNEDIINKKELYALMGVKEYFIFDPLREYLKNGLMGFCLERKTYVSVPLEKDGRMSSRELGTFLQMENELLRIIDPETGKPVPDLDEAMRSVEKTEQKIRKAEKRIKTERLKAEKRIKAERLKAEKKIESERLKAEKLAARLRALGIDPDEDV